MAKCNEIKDALEAKGIRVQMDTRDIRPGKKFFDWELKGTPLRFELGPRDLNNNLAIIGRRDTGEKIEVSLDDDIAEKVSTGGKTGSVGAHGFGGIRSDESAVWRTGGAF